MKTSQRPSWSLLAVLSIMVVFVSISCSKKDVKQDEPGFSSSGDSGGGTTTSEGTVGAGDVGAASSELGIAYFAYDSFKLDGTARSALKKNAEWLKSNSAATVQIEGHCDERGTTEYNLALGERRANAARDYLTKLGIAADRLSVISYGEERPQDPGHDESAWSKNRRAAFVILSR